MPDSVVGRWKQEYPIYLWRYTERTRNYPGWNLTAPDDSCRAVVGLLDLMIDAKFSSRKELRITPPPQSILRVPNKLGGNAASKTVDTVLVKYPKGEVEPIHWQMETEDRRMVLTLGYKRIQEIRKGLAELPDGVDDYCIGPSDKDRRGECLWFWNFPAR